MKSNCKSELWQVWDVSTEKVGEAGVGRELSRRGWGVMLAVAELVNDFRWSQPFDHIESNNSGVRWLNCAYCCVCGVQIVLQTAFGRLSVFRSRHYGARLCPSFVLLVYLRYGARLWFWVWYFRNGNRESPHFSGLNRSAMSMWYKNTNFCRVKQPQSKVTCTITRTFKLVLTSGLVGPCVTSVAKEKAWPPCAW